METQRLVLRKFQDSDIAVFGYTLPRSGSDRVYRINEAVNTKE
ncbi:hypothetical protein [Nostoc sp.]